jgi:hypothetical protein
MSLGVQGPPSSRLWPTVPCCAKGVKFPLMKWGQGDKGNRFDQRAAEAATPAAVAGLSGAVAAAAVSQQLQPVWTRGLPHVRTYREGKRGARQPLLACRQRAPSGAREPRPPPPQVACFGVCRGRAPQSLKFHPRFLHRRTRGRACRDDCVRLARTRARTESRPWWHRSLTSAVDRTFSAPLGGRWCEAPRSTGP